MIVSNKSERDQMHENHETQNSAELLRKYGEMAQSIAETLPRIINKLPMLEGQDALYGHLVAQALEEFQSKYLEITQQKTEALAAFSKYTIHIADTADQQQ